MAIAEGGRRGEVSFLGEIRQSRRRRARGQSLSVRGDARLFPLTSCWRATSPRPSAAILADPQVTPLRSTQHFSGVGTLIELGL